jgi:hypothetical protein
MRNGEDLDVSANLAIDDAERKSKQASLPISAHVESVHGFPRSRE